MKINKLESGKIWTPSKVIEISYELEQRRLYESNDPGCIYDQFERQVGINKGNFVEMTAKKHFKDKGYHVESFYYLVRNRTKREGMSGFHKIIEIFGEAKVRRCITEADAIFLSYGKRSAAGDPNLFIYQDGSPKDCFFAEVKENDPIQMNQHILFPIIERHLCPVYVARVRVVNSRNVIVI
jgi:hypothetical protein